MNRSAGPASAGKQGKVPIAPSPRPEPAPEPIPISNGTVVLTGYAVSVDVDSGLLRCRDGLFQKREARFDKPSQLRRLVILGHSGSISLKALRWLSDAQASLIQVDSDGEVVAASVPRGLDSAALRRSQALAPFTETGMTVTRYLLGEKLAGQAKLTREALHNEDVARRIDVNRETLDFADSLESLRGLEADAASWYWSAWEKVPVTFARRDEKRVNPRWLSFGPRQSPLSGSTRKAVTPGNSLLNYCYSILEAETRVALVVIGLDAGLAILHSDTVGRASFALDVMEAVRPRVDAWLLDLLNERIFRKIDFGELPDGTIRLTIDLARELTATAQLWRQAVAPVAEKVAQMLLDANRPGASVPTLLTGAKRRAARARVQERERQTFEDAPASADPPPPVESARQPDRESPSSRRRPRTPGTTARTCAECGKPLADSGRKFCSQECFNAHAREVRIPKLVQSSHGGDAAAKRGASNVQRWKERQEWEAAHPNLDVEAERARFAAQVQPRLARFSLSQIIGATGVSLRYASLIRRGEYVPHAMFFAALESLVELSAPDGNE